MLNSRMEGDRRKNLELENKTVEITQSEQWRETRLKRKKKKKKKRNEQNLRDPGDYLKKI